MDRARFDALARAVYGSRRTILASTLALPAYWLGAPETNARKKRKNKKRKQHAPVATATPNVFGCLEVGDPCQSAAQCCSSICEGGICRAHGIDACLQNKPGICLAAPNDFPSLACGPDNSACHCFTTTAGSSFCSSGVDVTNQHNCEQCKTDADCVALGWPSGSACAPVSRGHCNGFCDTGMACLVPCGVAWPDPIP